MTGFGPSQPEVGSTGRVEYSQDVKVPHQSNYSCYYIARVVLAVDHLRTITYDILCLVVLHM